MSKTTSDQLNEKDFFFIVGDNKTPYRKIGNGYVNMSSGSRHTFPPDEPIEVRKTFIHDLKAKYQWSDEQIQAWIEHMEERLT